MPLKPTKPLPPGSAVEQEMYLRGLLPDVAQALVRLLGIERTSPQRCALIAGALLLAVEQGAALLGNQKLDPEEVLKVLRDNEPQANLIKNAVKMVIGSKKEEEAPR